MFLGCFGHDSERRGETRGEHTKRMRGEGAGGVMHWGAGACHEAGRAGRLEFRLA